MKNAESLAQMRAELRVIASKLTTHVQEGVGVELSALELQRAGYFMLGVLAVSADPSGAVYAVARAWLNEDAGEPPLA